MPLLLMPVVQHFMSRSHGGDADPVPPKWRDASILRPASVYGLSSFNYSLSGLLLVGLLSAHPGRALHSGEHVEAALLIWQGLISYRCDAIDLCVDSWSHPADRICATVFTLYYVVKHLSMTCEGSLSMTICAFVWAMLGVGLFAFSRSCRACHEENLRAYAFWHTAWHVVFPATLAVFHLAQYCAPQDALQCYLSPWGAQS